MKYLCMILFLLATVGLNAAKVALIPAVPEMEPVADHVLAAMSQDSGVEFLERTAINTLLSERKLSAARLTGTNILGIDKTIQTDLFVVISAKAGKTEGKPVPSGLIIYDAHNGFRRANIPLPEKPDDCVIEIVRQLRQTVEDSKHPEKQILLSIATVRDAGVPERFKYQQAFIASDIERRLGNIPGVMVLERDYLSSVNQERQLTGEIFKLAPSARLIRLEFAPGSSPEIVNLTLRITDNTSNELFRFEQDNCYAGNTAEKAIVAIAAYLKEPIKPETGSATVEAARFYEEFCFLRVRKDYRAARTKLNAAIALDFQSRTYRCWEMAFNQEEVPHGNYRKLLECYQKNMELVRDYNRDFPNNRNYLYTNHTIFARHNFRKGSTPQDFAMMAEVMKVFRPLYIDEYMRLASHFNLRNGINSYAEWQNYNLYCWRLCTFELYYDCDEWAAATHKIAMEHLKVSRDFAEKHPELCMPQSFDSQLFRYMVKISHMVRGLRNNTTFESLAVGEKILANCDEYIAAASNHPLLQLRIDALQLKLLRDTVKNRYDAPAFTCEVTGYCQQSVALNGKIFGVIGVREFGNYFGANNDYSDIAWKVKAETPNPDSKKDTMEDMMTAINATADWEDKVDKFIELAPELMHHKDQAFVDVKVRNFFFDLGAKIAKNAYAKNDITSRKALDILNENIKIEQLASVSDVYEKKKKQPAAVIKNVSLDGNNLDLLLSIKKKEKAGVREYRAIARIDLKTAKTQLLTPWTPPAEPVTESNSDRRTPFAIEDNLVAIAGNKTIYVMSLEDNEFHEIKDLPSPDIMAIAILNKRLYIFVGEEKEGRNNYAFETILFSCDPDGGNRKLHISTSRDDKKDFLEFKTPFSVFGMIADRSHNRLFFNPIFTRYNGNIRSGSGLWEYNLTTNTSIPRIRTPHMSEIDPQISTANGMIFCSFFKRDYYIFDMNANHAELFFSPSMGNAKYCIEAKYSQGKNIGYKPGFFSRQGQIWFGGENCVKMLTLPDISQSPFIFLPPADSTTWHRLVYPHPDGKSAIVIDEKNIYKVTPKENIQ